MMKLYSLDLREGATETTESVCKLMADARYTGGLQVRVRCVVAGQGGKRAVGGGDAFVASSHLVHRQRGPFNHVTAIDQLDALWNRGTLDETPVARETKMEHRSRRRLP